MIRLVMSDLDGTLLTDDKTVSKATMAALQELKHREIAFGIATGRSLVAVEKLVHQWGIASLCDVLVGMNGSQILDMKTGVMTQTHLLSGRVILGIIEACRHLDVNFVIYDESMMYVLKNDERARTLALNNNFTLVVTDFSDVCQRDHAKLLITCEPEYMETMKAFAATLPMDTYRGFQTDHHLFEFVDSAVSKSFGVKQVCDMMGFEMDEVMAFGDNNNDLEMIRDAGIGVCMANGTRDAKAVADVIVKSNQEDGLAAYIMEYLATAAVNAT